MPLNNYQKTCYRLFGKMAEGIAAEKLKTNLEGAHMNIRAEAYISIVWFNTILVAIVTTLISLSFILLLQLEFMHVIMLLLIPLLSSFIGYLIYMNLPAAKAKTRAKKIDLHLPYALNFIAAMSSAGIIPTEIFKSLSKQNIYGEIREEALWIYRDVSLLGRDIISAIKANIDRTPSDKFKEFLQGAVVTVTSGGALKKYFMVKAEQYMKENRIAQKQLNESLGIMAESYVTVGVAGILLLLVVIPVMMVISGNFDLTFLMIIIFLIAPLIHLGFGFVLLSMTQRV
jgi:flagellar protein FlaJ